MVVDITVANLSLLFAVLQSHVIVFVLVHCSIPRTWREVVEEDCQARKLNNEDAVDYSRWRKLITMFDDYDECELVKVFSGIGPLR